MQVLSRLVLPTGCGSPGIGPPPVNVDQPLPFEIPISQVLEPMPVVHQKSVFISPLRRSCVRLPVKHRSATDVAGAGPSQDGIGVDQPTCAAVFETEESTMKTERSRSGIRRLARAAACAFRANPEKSALFSVIIGWLLRPECLPFARILHYFPQPIGSILELMEGESLNYLVEKPSVSEPATRSFAPLRMTVEGFSMTVKGFRVTVEGFRGTNAGPFRTGRSR